MPEAALLQKKNEREKCLSVLRASRIMCTEGKYFASRRTRKLSQTLGAAAAVDEPQRTISWGQAKYPETCKGRRTNAASQRQWNYILWTSFEKSIFLWCNVINRCWLQGEREIARHRLGPRVWRDDSVEKSEVWNSGKSSFSPHNEATSSGLAWYRY